MAHVFLAKRTQAGVTQTVALKLNYQLAAIGQRRFLAESKILASLKHSNIAHFIEAGLSDEGISYVAMEYVEGKEIVEHARHLKLNLLARLRLILQVLSAASYAHEQLVVHRDIKPSNVLVDASGNVKLLDFGIAKLMGENPAITASVDRSYTRLYAAPEQLTGEQAGVRTDVYAIAQLCYELITNTAPFHSFANAPGQLERAILSVPPVSLVDASKTASANLLLGKLSKARLVELDSILQLALRKESQSRYSSADKFAEDLAAFIESRPIKARASSGFYRFTKFVGRNRAASVFALVSGILLIFSVVSITLQNNAIRSERDRAEAALKVFNEAIAATDPAGNEAGRNSIRDVLARALESAEPLQKVQANTYISIVRNIGQMQYEIGEFEEAYETAELLVGAAQNTEQRKQAYTLLFTAMISTSRELEALKKYDEILALGFSDDPTILVGYAQLLHGQGKHELAKQSLERALVNSDKHAPDYLWTKASLELANAYRALGSLEQAIKILDDTVENTIKVFSADHTFAIRARLFRVTQLRRMKLFARAKAEGVQIIETASRKFGVNSAFYGRTCGSYAATLVDAGQYAEALPYFEKALTAFEQSMGLMSRSTIEARFNLAQFESYLNGKPDLERYEQSVRDAERAQFFRLALFFRSHYADQLSRQNLPERALAALVSGLRTEHLTNTPDADKREIARQGLELLQKGACQVDTRSWSTACSTQDRCTPITEICQLRISEALTTHFN